MKIELIQKKDKHERKYEIPSDKLQPGLYKLFLDKQENSSTVCVKDANLSDAFFKDSIGYQIDFETFFYRYTEEKNNLRISVLAKTHASADIVLKAFALHVIKSLKLPVLLSFGNDFENYWINNYPFDLCVFNTREVSLDVIDDYKETKRIVLQKFVSGFFPPSDVKNMIDNRKDLTHLYDLFYPTHDFEDFEISDLKNEDCPYYSYSYLGILQQCKELQRIESDKILNEINERKLKRERQIDDKIKEHKKNFEEWKKENEKKFADFLNGKR